MTNCKFLVYFLLRLWHSLNTHQPQLTWNSSNWIRLPDYYFFFLSFFCWGGPQQFEHTHNTYTLNLRLQSTTIFPELDQDLWFMVFFIRSSSVIRQIFWINSSVYRMTNMYNVWTKMYIAYRQKKVLWNVFL